MKPKTFDELIQDVTNGERNAESHTREDFIEAVKLIDCEEEARLFHQSYKKWLESFPPWCLNGKPVERVAQVNLGSVFECLIQSKIDMWHQATGAFHEVYGTKIPMKTTPTRRHRRGRRQSRQNPVRRGLRLI